MIKVRALVTIQGSEETHKPKSIFEIEPGKELDRLLKNNFVELYEGQDLPANARFIGEQQPPPKFEDGVEDGAKDDKSDDVIFKSDPGDVPPPKTSKKKGKK